MPLASSLISWAAGLSDPAPATPPFVCSCLHGGGPRDTAPQCDRGSPVIPSHVALAKLRRTAAVGGALHAAREAPS